MKLRTKFSLLTCTLTLIVVAGVTASLYIAERNLLLSEMRENQNSIVNGFVEISRESLITSNEILLINYLNKIIGERSVQYAMLVSLTGEITAHTDVEMIGSKVQEPINISAETLKTSSQSTYSDTKGDLILLRSTPVTVNREPGGIIWVAFSQTLINSIIDETLRETRRRILAVAALGLLIGIIGAVILSAMMTRPIKQMAKGAAAIGKGRLDTVIHVKSRDELGGLANNLNRMAEQLKELDQMKQDFVSSITHEFRSPLNAMGIHFDLLLKGHLGEINEKQSESVEILKKNASRLAVFIDDLLDVAKIERGKIAINVKEFETGSLIQETVDFYKVQADKNSLALKTDISAGLPEVLADPDRTRQVLTNLLNNAIKFTDAGGTITVSSAAKGKDYIEIAIKDTGMGIPKDQLDSIFNKFEQVKGIRQKVSGQKGTGLGLSIVKGIVEAQGGSIRVDSEEGKGTTFAFTLPVKD